MHPLLATKGRIVLYVTAWLPVAALLGYLLSFTGRLPLPETEILTIPLTLLFALACLAPWYMCRVLPLGPAALPRLIGNHLAAAVVAALLWIVLAKAFSVVLGYRYLPQLDQRFSPQLPLLFGVGVLFYLLSVAMHYVLLSMESSREAEIREQEARTLAREAELKALREQINPHFLFNSLNSISALATLDGTRARDMCIKLSDFLRSTLSVGDKSSIPLAEELALARAYLAVEQVRFGARLNVDVSVDPRCDNCPVPPLLIQPLVENAVKHGIAGLTQGGTVRIRAACRDARLRLRVENEFDPEAPSVSRHGLGLRNVRERLAAIYEQRARLDTQAADGRYLVEAELPCARHE